MRAGLGEKPRGGQRFQLVMGAWWRDPVIPMKPHGSAMPSREGDKADGGGGGA